MATTLQVYKQRRLGLSHTSVERPLLEVELRDFLAADVRPGAQHWRAERLERIRGLLASDFTFPPSLRILKQIHAFLLLSLSNHIWQCRRRTSKVPDEDNMVAKGHGPSSQEQARLYPQLVCSTLQNLYRFHLHPSLLDIQEAREAYGVLFRLMDCCCTTEEGHPAVAGMALNLARHLIANSSTGLLEEEDIQHLCALLVSLRQSDLPATPLLHLLCHQYAGTSWVALPRTALMALMGRTKCSLEHLNIKTSTDRFALRCWLEAGQVLPKTTALSMLAELCTLASNSRDEVSDDYLKIMLLLLRRRYLDQESNGIRELFRLAIESKLCARRKLVTELLPLIEKDKSNVHVLLQDVEYTKRLLSSLVEIILVPVGDTAAEAAFHANSAEAITATKLALLLMNQLLMSRKEPRSPSCGDLMAICLVLVEVENNVVPYLTARFLCKQLCLVEGANIVETSPEIVTCLAQVAHRFVTNRTLQCSIAQALKHLTSCGDTQVQSILVRQPKVLELLVQLCNSEDHKTVELAASAVLNLSENVLNRRIIAKQVGLLASLIRYTRVAKSGRENLKQRILLLATLL